MGKGVIESLERRLLMAAGGDDPAFGGNGVTSFMPLPGFDVATELLPAPGGKLLVFGQDTSGNLEMARFTANGAVDETFGPDDRGVATTNVQSPSGSAGHAQYAIDPWSGRI